METDPERKELNGAGVAVEPIYRKALDVALSAWKALPEYERNGERPWIMGFNAGWEEALSATTPPEPEPGLTAALQLIADLPTARTEEVMEGREDAYRVIEAVAGSPNIHRSEPGPVDELEAMALAIASQLYGPGFDPFTAPEHFEHCEKMASAALTAQRSAKPEPVDDFTFDPEFAAETRIRHVLLASIKNEHLTVQLATEDLRLFVLTTSRMYQEALTAQRGLTLAKPDHFRWGMDQLLRKKSGSQWHGKVVGFYQTELTPEGYAVESEAEKGSVQIYPAKALEEWGGGLTLTKEGVGWVCAARGSVGANDPQDCDYPDCECDPNAKRLDDYGTALNNLNWHLIDVRKALAELSASSEEVMTLLRNASAMQGREHIGVGSRFADAMAAAKIALSPQTAEPLAGGKTEGGA